jgi:hypothetical protein
MIEETTVPIYDDGPVPGIDPSAPVPPQFEPEPLAAEPLTNYEICAQGCKSRSGAEYAEHSKLAGLAMSVLIEPGNDADRALWESTLEGVIGNDPDVFSLLVGLHPKIADVLARPLSRESPDSLSASEQAYLIRQTGQFFFSDTSSPLTQRVFAALGDGPETINWALRVEMRLFRGALGESAELAADPGAPAEIDAIYANEKTRGIKNYGQRCQDLNAKRRCILKLYSEKPPAINKETPCLRDCLDISTKRKRATRAQ